MYSTIYGPFDEYQTSNYMIINKSTSEHFSDKIYISPIITATTSKYLSSTNTGLGNVLFQIASVYGISKTVGLSPCFYNVLSYCDKLKLLFNYDHGTTILRNFIKNLSPISTYIKINEPRERCVDSSLFDQIKNSKENIVLEGYFEHADYFHHVKDEIRSLLAMDDNSKTYIFDTYPFLQNHTNLVCVHYRYGKDILDLSKHQLHHDFYKNPFQIYLKKLNPFSYYLVIILI